MATKALILGGGAPNGTIMAGGVWALYEAGVRFDVISTSGYGALVGLLCYAAKDKTPEEALRDTINLSIEDLIFAVFPVNYKAFHKSFPYSDLYRNFAETWLKFNPLYSEKPQTQAQRFIHDWFQLMASLFMPSDLSPMSKGMAANVPWIEEVIDFEGLKNIEPQLYINAYNITDKVMETFPKEEITGDHFRASVAFPFIYPPFELNGKYYFEGAAHDCLNYRGLLENHPELETLVIFDIIGEERLVRVPKNLWDAYIISIITPLVEIAKDDTKIFACEHNKDAQGRDIRKLLTIEYEHLIPEEHWPHVLDWSYSNLSRLFDVGYEAGKEFIRKHEKELF